MSYTESQRRACKKYYETHREYRIEKAKEYSKARYDEMKAQTIKRYYKEYTDFPHLFGAYWGQFRSIEKDGKVDNAPSEIVIKNRNEFAIKYEITSCKKPSKSLYQFIMKNIVPECKDHLEWFCGKSIDPLFKRFYLISSCYDIGKDETLFESKGWIKTPTLYDGCDSYMISFDI